MQPPVIFLIGPPGHGKTESRKILSEITHLKGQSTSEVIYAYLAERRGTTIAELKKIPKEELRAELIKAGDYLCGQVGQFGDAPAEIDSQLYRIPSALVRMLYLAGHNIIDGVRRRLELSDAIKHLEWNGVRSLVLWIQRPAAPIIKDNTELSPLDAHLIIDNDGTLEELRGKLFHTLELTFGKQDELNKPVPVVDLSAQKPSIPVPAGNEL